MSTPLEKKRAENLKQAAEAMAKAQKFTKKTLTRWTPDWESAGRFYRDAVKLYKLAGDDSKTIQACRESAVCHDELGQFLTTATDLETAASLMAKDSAATADKRKAAFDCFRESGINYRKNNSYEKSAAMYVKAAEVMEAAGDTSAALEALQEACSVFEDEQRGQFHDSTFKLCIGKAVKWGRYDAAIAFMKRQTALVKEQQLLSTFATDVHKNYLQCMVLLYQQGEVQQAQELFEQAEAAGDRFPQSDQYPAAAALVDAYDSADSEKLGEALKLTPFKYIMNSIAVIARKLQMTEGKQRKRSRKTEAQSAAAAGAADAAEEDEKDEDDFT